MSARDWMYLIAAAGHLTLAVVSLARGERSPVARPLALLCLAMFGWCVATLAYHVTGAAPWNVLDAIFTALSPAPLLHLVVVFVGASRARRSLVLLAYAAFGSLALSSASGFVGERGRAWIDSSTWPTLFLAGYAPALALVLLLLVRHLVRSNDPDEKARTRTMLAAIAIGGAMATTDVLGALGVPLPYLASIGTLAGTFLVATAAFRFRLFDRDLSVSTGVYAAALALAGVASYLVLFLQFGGNIAVLTFSTASITLLLGAAVRELTASLAAQKERVERLAVLGRFSSQLAHDMKNPIATLRGALQFLQEERARGNSLDAQAEFLDIMLEEVDRLHRVVDDYQRIGRVQPILRPVDINDLVRGVVALEPFAAKEGIAIRSELAADLPACQLDGDLVSGALQNVIRNAFEAMPEGGKVTVRTERAADGVVISVEDSGNGMDARQAERALDEFYSTKPTGSGLGLAFVRRVAHAHGGDVSLKSTRGEGTIVRLRFSAA